MTCVIERDQPCELHFHIISGTGEMSRFSFLPIFLVYKCRVAFGIKYFGIKLRSPECLILFLKMYPGIFALLMM